MQIGEQIHGQRGFGLEHHRGWDHGMGSASVVLDPLAGQVRSGTYQGMPTAGGQSGVHDVDRVGDPAGAADVLAFDPRGRFALFLLPGLVQYHHCQAVVTGAQTLGDEPGHHTHRRVLVPHRVVE